MCQGDVGVFAGVSLPEVEFAYEVAGVVEHVVDGSGEAEQVLAVQWRGPCLSQCVDDLGADLVAFVFDVVDVFPGFLDAGVAFDGVKGDGYAFASGGGLFPEQAHDGVFRGRVLRVEPRHCGTFFLVGSFRAGTPVAGAVHGDGLPGRRGR